MFSSTRLTSWLIFVCLGRALALCEGAGYPPAPNCARLECPPYSVVFANKDFEIRCYNTSQWVSSPTISSKTYRLGSNKGFLVLFGYYLGKNDKYQKIEMTTPVLVDIDNSTYTVYFYLPKKYQESPPPKPLASDNIKFEKLPKYKYAAVRRFDGFISEKSNEEQLAALKKAVQGTPYQRAAALPRFTVAGYDSPFELLNRVNEIFLWFD